LATYELEADQI